MRTLLLSPPLYGLIALLPRYAAALSESVALTEAEDLAEGERLAETWCRHLRELVVAEDPGPIRHAFLRTVQTK